MAVVGVADLKRGFAEKRALIRIATLGNLDLRDRCGRAGMAERISIIGLGYVGLPVAVGLARHFDGVVEFDINSQRLAAMREGVDVTREFTLTNSRALTSPIPTTLRPLPSHSD